MESLRELTKQAFAVAEGDHFFLLDNDALVSERWLENAVKIMESDPRICTVGSTQISFEDYYRGGTS